MRFSRKARELRDYGEWKTRIFRVSPKCYILFLPESSLQVFCLTTPVFLTYVQTEAVLQCGIAGKYNM